MSRRSRAPRWRHVVAIGAVAVLVAAACSPAPSATPRSSGIPGASGSPATPAAFVPTFAAAPCPDDVTGQIVIAASCGYLTVLENRAKSDGAKVRIFVLKTEPPGGTSTPDPMVVVGDVAATPDYGGLATLSERVHRVEFVIDPRGAGHSEPNLDCPEVADASPTLVGLRFRDQAHASALLAAAQACHDRLAGQGIDLAAYDLAANAADVRDLRAALGIGTWNAIAYGPATQSLLELARLYPEGLRSITLDSPVLVEPGSLAAGPAALDLSIARLAGACAADRACDARAPHLERMIASAVAKLDANPAVFDVDGTVRSVLLGHPTHVVVDGAALLRAIRSFGSERPDGRRVIATVLRVLDGSLDGHDASVMNLSTDVGDCLGMLPLCARENFGVLYSHACGEAVSPDAGSALDAEIAGRGAYIDLFSPGPLAAVCRAWGVAPASTLPAGPLAGGVPVLMVRGTMDPFSSTPDAIQAASVGSPDVYLVEIPNIGNNALSPNGCVVAARNAWVDAPAAPPDVASCLASIPRIDFGR